MTVGTTTRRRRKAPADFSTATDLDAAIEASERDAVIVWRGERIAYASMPQRIAAIGDRGERNALFRSYLDAVEAINPLREERLRRIGESARASSYDGLVHAVGATFGFVPDDLAVEMQRFLVDSETVYFAALRRYLALVDIEQGDATEADLWHVRRGGGWTRWFAERRLAAAIAAASGARSAGSGTDSETDWLGAADRLAAAGRGVGDGGGGALGGEAVGMLYASLLTDPEWLTSELRIPDDQAMAFVDFTAFWRLWRLRRDVAYLGYELRLYRTDDADLRRAYFNGLVSLVTGVAVPEEGYLAEVAQPFASGVRLRTEMLGAMAGEALHARHGAGWWRDAAARDTVRRLGAAPDAEHAIAQLEYDQLDWRPVLRQIRTQLIGEMSGYGGPNITTRAGTRKV
ncbi:MAG: hypothetical protein ACRDGV_11695 [Candidatus Limnocylindria bacterium]